MTTPKDNGGPEVSTQHLSLKEREQLWSLVIKIMSNYRDANSKAVLVQNAIAEFGPVPNSMDDAVREAMKARGG